MRVNFMSSACRYLSVMSVVLLALGSSSLPPFRGKASRHQGDAGLVKLARPAIPLCGVAYPLGGPRGTFRTPASVLGARGGTGVAAGQKDIQPATAVVPATDGIETFAVANGQIYAASKSLMFVLSEQGVLQRQIHLPSVTLAGEAMTGLDGVQMAADRKGDTFFVEGRRVGGAVLVELSATGKQMRDALVGTPPNGVYAWSARGRSSIALLSGGEDITEASAISAPHHGRRPRKGPVSGMAALGSEAYVTQAANGDLVLGTAGFVRFYDVSGRPLPSSTTTVPYFGSRTDSSELAGASFGLGDMGAVEVGSHVFVGDDAGIDEFSTTGVLEGTASWADLGVNMQFPRSPLYYDSSNKNLYVATGGGGVDAVPLASVKALVASPRIPLQNGFGDTLGVGAGLSTPEVANYFPSGSTPEVKATFDSWWRRYPHPLSLSYWVGSRAQVTAHEAPRPRTAPLAWGDIRANRPLTIPLDLVAADAAPGVYLVNADLRDSTTRRIIGSTCLTYSVGMAGDRLDFGGLPSGENYGGPGTQRGVALAAALGTGLYREQIDLATLLPNCTATNASEASCGPAALTNWSDYDPATEQAAVLALKDGVNFEVQVGQTGPSSGVDTVLVDKGFWQQDVKAILEHFHMSAPDLRYFEAWNEPNDEWSAANYVSKILRPFFNAAQQVNAADGTNDQVVGGTVVGEDLTYWDQIAAAGGFRDMNVASMHPYPGYDRSFEEQGTPAFVASLRALMAKNGAGSMNLWDTEQGWWSDGEEAFYGVGNWAPREWMWLKALGVTGWNYFITEGGYNGFGTDYSLIQAANEDDFVKPGAIGLMTVSNVLRNRQFIKQVELGIPHTFAMLFGPTSTASTDVLAVWTNDLSVPAEITESSGSPLRIGTTGVLGEGGTIEVSPSSPAPVELSGAPLYLTVPETAAGAISVAPREAFGSNLALASAGAKARASSSQTDHGPRNVIAGTGDAALNGGWEAAPDDTSPRITVKLRGPHTVNRVIVATSSIASVETGLRNFEVRLQAGGKFRTVAKVTNEYFSRMKLVAFPPVAGATAVEIVPTALDYNAAVGGLPPSWWTSGFPDFPLIYSVEAYGPTGNAKGSVVSS